MLLALLAAFGRAHDPGAAVTGDGGSDPAASAESRKKARPFLKAFSLAMELFESFPQLMLQVKAGIYGNELDGWVFILTFSASAFSILKAIVTFVLSRKEIREAFLDLHEEVEGEKEDIQRAVIDLYAQD